jgi:hypothetical protein
VSFRGRLLAALLFCVGADAFVRPRGAKRRVTGACTVEQLECFSRPAPKTCAWGGPDEGVRGYTNLLHPSCVDDETLVRDRQAFV